ncbi:MAG: 50S ribosomal protein L11 methyltransferase [Lachnospiraceae bacterium]|jgi:ribosomal protein L11 methyltransferase|nr:50S ribosomal protein L11 methyltransferase [Lachnospiraceae bacterium]
MRWNKFTIETITEAEDLVAATLAELGIQGVEIEDKQPLTREECREMFVDLLPEGPKDDGIAYVSFYLDEEEDKEKILEGVKEALQELKQFTDIGPASVTGSQTEDKDWMNNWKEYFHQFYVDDILIVPSWEQPREEQPYTMLLHMDPGTAFGTGMHETTQLCIRQLKKYVKPGMSLLDVGTGSGILGLVGCKLGIDHVLGTDLDPCAVSAVRENMQANHVPEGQFELIIGNIITDSQVQKQAGREPYDLVTANILADVLVPLSPVAVRYLKPGGLYITSGILDQKEEEVRQAVEQAGMKVIEITRQGEWVSLTAKKE